MRPPTYPPNRYETNISPATTNPPAAPAVCQSWAVNDPGSCPAAAATAAATARRAAKAPKPAITPARTLTPDSSLRPASSASEARSLLDSMVRCDIGASCISNCKGDLPAEREEETLRACLVVARAAARSGGGGGTPGARRCAPGRWRSAPCRQEGGPFASSPERRYRRWPAPVSLLLS